MFYELLHLCTVLTSHLYVYLSIAFYKWILWLFPSLSFSAPCNWSWSESLNVKSIKSWWKRSSTLWQSGCISSLHSHWSSASEAPPPACWSAAAAPSCPDGLWAPSAAPPPPSSSCTTAPTGSKPSQRNAESPDRDRDSGTLSVGLPGGAGLDWGEGLDFIFWVSFSFKTVNPSPAHPTLRQKDQLADLHKQSLFFR